MKVLTPLNGLNAKFLYYYLRSIKLPTFMRDQRTDQRIRARGGDGAMPSLEHLIEPEVVVRPGQAADLLAAFGKAKTTAAQEPPDLLAAFSRAAKSQDGGGSGEGASSALERARPPDPIKPDGPEKGRSRGQ